MAFASRTVATALTVLCTLTAAPARGETIVLTGGFLEWAAGWESPVLSLAGTDGFSLGGHVSISGGRFDVWSECVSVPECRAGEAASLGAGWSGSDLATTVTYRGATFEVGGGNLPGAAVSFDGSFVVPAGSGVVTAPFTVTGSLQYPTDGPAFGVATLRGAGDASIWLSPWGDPLFPNALRVDRIRYELRQSAEPIPEPASMLLIGAGLAGAFAAKRRRLRT